MKSDGFYSERVNPVIIMAVITIVCIALVSGIHLATREIVIANEGLVLKRAVLYASGVDVPDSNAGINDLFDSRVKQNGDVYLVNDAAGSLQAAAFITTGPGLWGEIDAVTAFKPDLTTFAGVDFVKQSETPGLGARITESWFKEQLRGKKPPVSLVPEGTKSTTSGEIDAITGASFTSGYVRDIFNKAGKHAAELKKEGLK